MIPGSIDEIDDERAGDMGLDLDRSRIGPVSSSLAQFGPGAHFGELSVLGTHNALISVYGAEPGGYLFIEAGKLKAHLDARPTLQAKIMRNIIVSLDHDLLQVKEIIKTLYTRRNNAK